MTMNNVNAPAQRRKHNILLSLLLIAMAAAGASSCTDDYLRYTEDYDNSDEGEEATLPISLLVEPMVSKDPKTKAMTYEPTTPDEKKIADFWIIEYNEYGTRVGKPRYYKIFDLHMPGSVPESTASTRAVSPPDVEWTETESGDGVSSDKLNILVPREGQGDFTCVVIANTHNDNLFNASNRSKFSTLDSLRNCDMDIHNQHDLFNPNKDDLEYPERYLPMSGWTKISRDSRDLNIKLIRNVCKVHIQLLNFTDELVFKYYQWRNVPFSQLFPHGSDANYTQKVSRDWIQHSEPGRLDSLKNGLDFWLPCNVWLPEDEYYHGGQGGGSGSGNIKRKEDATFFDIACRGAKSNGPIGDKEIYEFTLYPSMTVGEQFDFEANHYYKIDVDINTIPLGNPFFKSMDYIHLPESNCYMVRRDTKGVYAVPIYRINRYFGEVYGDIDEVNFEDMPIKDDTEWVAEVIWQDTPLRILDFGVNGDEDAANARDKFEGIGAGDIARDEEGEPLYDEATGFLQADSKFFAFRTTGTGEGNVVIGVRKRIDGELPPVEEREYLWSWHIWITDYDPDSFNENTTWGNRQAFNVPRGQVHRLFNGLEKMFQIDGEDLIEQNWADGAYLMDRNLGATSVAQPPYSNPNDTIPSTEEIRERLATFGLFYQYGRKDPFPFPSVVYQGVYDIKGELIPAFNSHKIIELPSGAEETRGTSATTMIVAQNYGDHPEEGSITKSIHQPYKFFARAGAGEEWCNDAQGDGFEDDYNWGTGSWYMANDNKSIFDPCPPGWRVMDGELFKFLEVRDDNAEGGNYCEMKHMEYLNLMNWDIGERVYGFHLKSMDPNMDAWFPTMGRRYGDTGCGMLFLGSGQDNDASTPIWTCSGTALRYNHGDIRVPTGAGKENFTSGCAVRCMRNNR